MTEKQTFKKKERLCSKVEIDKLFQHKKTLFVYPFRLVWLARPSTDESDHFARVGISVAKKKIRRANKRNLLKRRVREIFRTHKQELNQFLKDEGLSLDFFIIYAADKPLSYQELLPGYVAVQKKLIKELTKQYVRENTEHA